MLWILSLWLLVAGIALLATHPSEGYEPSIYAIVSPATWIALLGCALGGLWSSIWAATDSRTSRTNAWAVGFGIVTAVSVVIILAPILRGYTGHARADLMVHAGRIVDIQRYERIPEYDRASSTLLYPAPIIILTQISLMAGVEPFVLIQFTTLATFLLGVLFTYLLAKTVLSHPLAITLCMLASSVLLLSSFNYQVLPTALGFTLFPLVLWLYLQADTYRSVAYRFVLVLVVITYAFIHPITSVNLLVGLAATEVYRVVREARASREDNRISLRSDHTGHASTGIILLIFVALVTWLTHNWFFWELTVHQMINLITLLGRGAYSQSLSHLRTVDLNLAEAILLLIKMHGHHLLYVAVAAIGGITVLGKAASSRHNPTASKLTTLIIFLGAQGFILVAILFGGSGSVSYWRALAPIVLLAPAILGHLGHHLFIEHVGRQRIRRQATINSFFLRAGTMFLLFFAFSLGVFSFFPSLYTYRLNQQVSAAELEGMDWFTQHRDETIALDSITVKYVFGAALEGFALVDKRLNPTHPKWGETMKIPAHFDYSLERRDIETFPVYYLPIHQYDQLYHTLIPRNPARLSQSDFEKLSDTPYINRVYANGELDLWMVYAERAARRKGSTSAKPRPGP